MSGVKIAIASDLHIGKAARAKDLQIPGEGGAIADRESFLDAFGDFFQGQVTADYLIVPGDISNTARPEEFDLAFSVVRKIADVLKVPHDKIISIPGNHDVDWSVIKGDVVHPMRVNQRFDPFLHQFASKLSSSAQGLTKAPYFNVWSWPDLYIVGYNSAWHDQPEVSQSHHGRVDSNHMMEIKKQILSDPPDPGAFRLFLVHHHPYQYMDFLREWDDFSVMQNVEALQDLLFEFKFDALVHGHKHFPNFNTHSINAGHSVIVLGAGSFCRSLDTRWNGIVANQFHLMEVTNRDASSGASQGIVRSWAYLASSGWAKSYHTGEAERMRRRGTGIEFEKRFGFYASPNHLVDRITDAIKVKLNNKSLINISEIFQLEPNLRFAPNEALSLALKEFCATGGYAEITKDDQRYLIQMDEE